MKKKTAKKKSKSTKTKNQRVTLESILHFQNEIIEHNNNPRSKKIAKEIAEKLFDREPQIIL